jgi:hypothetical protein
MNNLAILSGLLSMLMQVPVVGPVVVFILGLVLPLSAAVTAMVLLWQAIVGMLKALAAIPGLSSLSGIANSLSVEEQAAENFVNNQIVPLLKTLSAIPLPVAAAKVAAASVAAPKA